MAVLDGNNNQTDPKDLQPKVEKVDFANWKGPKGEAKKIDADADAWEYPAPPNADWYQFKHFLTDDGIQFIVPKDNKGKELPERAFYKATLDLRLQSDEKDLKNYSVEASVNTIIGRGKDISTMAGLIVKFGGKKYLKSQMTDFEVAELFSKIIKQEVVIWNWLDWRGSYKDVDGWNQCCNSQEDFPDDKDNPNKKLHKFEVSGKDKTKKQVSAFPYIREFGGKEKPTKSLKSKNSSNMGLVLDGNTAPVGVKKGEVLELDLGGSNTPVVASNSASKDDADVELLLG